MKRDNLGPEDIEEILNKQSGAWGVSGVSLDYKDIEIRFKVVAKAEKLQDGPREIQAFFIFCEKNFEKYRRNVIFLARLCVSLPQFNKKRTLMVKKQPSILSRLFKTYLVDALSFMAMGLFCSLILGLIIKQIALIPGLDFLTDIAALLQSAPVVGGSIGMAIALGLKRAPLVTISSVAVGALGYQFGGPIGAYLASIVGVEAGSLVSKRTPVDIIITPLVAVVVGGLFAKYCCAPINEWVMSLGAIINRATMLQPFIMGVVVSVSVGCILTLPISSAALCISIGISGLAAGAATANAAALTPNSSSKALTSSLSSKTVIPFTSSIIF